MARSSDGLVNVAWVMLHCNRRIGARERRQLIPHVRFQVPFLGPESQLKSGSYVRASSGSMTLAGSLDDTHKPLRTLEPFFQCLKTVRCFSTYFGGEIFFCCLPELQTNILTYRIRLPNGRLHSTLAQMSK